MRSLARARRVGLAHVRQARRGFPDVSSLAGLTGLMTQQDIARGKLSLAFSAACIPHPDKAAKGGEDAYFACPRSRSFGVADGVGGWSESGVDPGEFARALLKYAHAAVRRRDGQQESDDLRDALRESAALLHEEELQGGTTALLGQLKGPTLTILNLGDSGVLVLRPALRTPPGQERPLLFPRVVFRSSDQTHYFNCPYQVSSGSGQVEEPDLVHVRVHAGDLVIAATDGVFDNLFDRQVQALAARHLGGAWRDGAEVALSLQQGAGVPGNVASQEPWIDRKKAQPLLKSLADGIVKQAARVGHQEDQNDVITPFAVSAHSEGLSFRGGKLDDTTVVVALVLEDGEIPSSQGDTASKLPHIHNFKQ